MEVQTASVNDAGKDGRSIDDEYADDGSFNVYQLIRIMEKARRPDGKIDMLTYVQSHEQYARLVMQMYGFLGRVVANIIRSGMTAIPDFFKSHDVTGDDCTADKVLDISDLDKVKARDHSEAGYLLAVETAFLSWAIRLYNDRDEPEAPGENFLRDTYHATYGNFHAWYQRKAADFLFGMHQGKEYWRQSFLHNQDLFPGDSVPRVVRVFTQLRDDLAELLRSRGLEELVFV